MVNAYFSQDLKKWIDTTDFQSPEVMRGGMIVAGCFVTATLIGTRSLSTTIKVCFIASALFATLFYLD